MATSSRRAVVRGAGAAALLAAVTAVVLALAARDSGAGSARAAVAAGPAPGALLASLRPAPAPSDWPAVSLPSGAATLHYPQGWSGVGGDAGTVSVALRDADGRYLGYLNVTPRQGDEHLRGWPAFRIGRNREEGDRGVRELAGSEAVAFPAAHGSCVVDDYASRVGAHPYRELACIVRGGHTESVLIAAASRPDWPRVAPSLARAAEAFRER
jgi:hypothetical protein